MKKIFCFAALLCSATLLNALEVSLGAVSARQVNIVVAPIETQFKLLLKDLNTGKETSITQQNGAITEIGKRTIKISLENLAPNTRYKYTFKGTSGEASGVFKTAPDYKDKTPPPDFSFAVIGKNYVNDKPFDVPFRTNGGEYEIFGSVENAKPDFALWVGGIDTLRPADTGSEGAMFYRFQKARALPEARGMLANVPSFGATAPAAFSTERADKYSPCAPFAKAAFDALWANPQNGGARYYAFSYADADFFVLDTCFERSDLDYKSHRAEILGAEQMKWLMANLEASRANFKIVVLATPFANPVKNPDNFTAAEGERRQLLDFLALKQIEGLLFVSGNKNYAEATRFIRAGGYPIFEITAGAFTDRPAADITEVNYFRVPNSAVKARSFVLVKIDGAENDRRASFTIIDAKGKTLWQTSVKQSELKGN